MPDMRILPPVSIEARRVLPSRWDVIAAALVLGFIILLADASRGVVEPLSTITRAPISLDPSNLPGYALRTGLRMLIGLGVSLVFTFTYATWAAKSPRASKLLVPLLDILQSVPILGFISATIVFFLSLAPGRVLGAEFAAVFVIFTSQAWNMAFSFYQSLRTLPPELEEAGRMFGLSAWGRFWRIEVPFAMPQLIWNMMMSMSGAWFSVVFSEAITVGNFSVSLPGIGSYIAEAVAEKNLGAIFWAIGAMLVVILIFDVLMFRPLVAWADRFRIDTEPSEAPPSSMVLTAIRRSQLMDKLAAPVRTFMHWTYRLAPPAQRFARTPTPAESRLIDIAWNAIVVAIAAYAAWRVVSFTRGALSASDFIKAFELGLITLLRVVVLIALASVIWTPIGIYVGLRPSLARFVQPIAQFLAAFPVNLLFPLVVSVIVAFNLNSDIWLSPLIILGTQWYILFNVIAGASALPRELRDAAENLQVHGLLWWRKVGLPGVFPYYVTGAITASGGSWNASVLAELAQWGTRTLRAHGLGAYIQDATKAGDFHRIVLGIAVMSFMVVVINRILWRPLYSYAERKFKLA
jgi:NitT/TauT family transport system permease protein